MNQRVKIFTAADKSEGFPHLEEEINAWLQANPNIEIVERLLSTSTGQSSARAYVRSQEQHQAFCDGVFGNVTIVIFYRSETK